MKPENRKKGFPIYSNLDRIDRLPHDDAVQFFLRCCNSQRWAEQMAALRPFRMLEHLFSSARNTWHELDDEERSKAIDLDHERGPIKRFAIPVQKCIVELDGAKVVRFPSKPAITDPEPVVGLRFAAVSYYRQMERRLSSLLET